MDCESCNKPDATFQGPDGLYCHLDCIYGAYRRLISNYGAFCEFYGADKMKSLRDELVKLLGGEDKAQAYAANPRGRMPEITPEMRREAMERGAREREALLNRHGSSGFYR